MVAKSTTGVFNFTNPGECGRRRGFFFWKRGIVCGETLVRHAGLELKYVRRSAPLSPLPPSTSFLLTDGQRTGAKPRAAHPICPRRHFAQRSADPLPRHCPARVHVEELYVGGAGQGPQGRPVQQRAGKARGTGRGGAGGGVCPCIWRGVGVWARPTTCSWSTLSRYFLSSASNFFLRLPFHGFIALSWQDTTKLISLYPDVPEIHEAVAACFRRMKAAMDAE